MNPSDNSPTQNPISSPDPGSRAAPGDTTRQKVRRVAGQTLDQTKGRLSAAAEHGKESAAGRVSGYSDRLRATARSAEEEDPNIAQLAHSAADRLQRAADYMREADLDRLRQDASDLAKRHPALFTGGMFAAGLILGGLAKASVQTLRENESSRDDANGDYAEGEAEARYTYEGAHEPMTSVSESFDAAPRDDSQT